MLMVTFPKDYNSAIICGDHYQVVQESFKVHMLVAYLINSTR